MSSQSLLRRERSHRRWRLLRQLLESGSQFATLLKNSRQLTLTGHNSGQDRHSSVSEMEYREDYWEDSDSDLENELIRAVHNLNIADRSARALNFPDELEVRRSFVTSPDDVERAEGSSSGRSSAGSEYEDHRLFEIYDVPREDTAHSGTPQTEGSSSGRNSSGSGYEDHRWFEFHDIPSENTAPSGILETEVNASDPEYEDSRLFAALTVDDHQRTEVNFSDSDFEDPRLFYAFDDISRVAAAHGDVDETQDYDPEFEDPRLFQFVFEDVLPEREPISNTTSRNSQQEEVPMEKHTWPCVVCVEKTPETLFTPCSHSVCCQECANYVKDRGGCPVCSFSIEIVDRIYYTQASCVVCLDSPPKAVFKPCCHAVCCEACSNTLVFGGDPDIERKCPVCKADIEEMKLFLLAYH